MAKAWETRGPFPVVGVKRAVRHYGRTALLKEKTPHIALLQHDHLVKAEQSTSLQVCPYSSSGRRERKKEITPNFVNDMPLFELCQENGKTSENFLHTDACWFGERELPCPHLWAVWQLCEVPGGGSWCSSSKELESLLSGSEAGIHSDTGDLRSQSRQRAAWSCPRWQIIFVHNADLSKTVRALQYEEALLCILISTKICSWNILLVHRGCSVLVLMTSSSFTPNQPLISAPGTTRSSCSCVCGAAL